MHSDILAANVTLGLVREHSLTSALKTELERLTKQSLLFGWWGIPWGPVYTVRALAVNSKAKTAAASAEPTPELWNYIASNISEIAADTRSTYRTAH